MDATPCSTQNEGLCQACQAIFVDSTDEASQQDPSYTLYGHTFKSLQESAISGCQLCAMQLHRLSNEQQDELFKHEHRIVLGYHHRARTSGPFMLRIRYKRGRNEGPILDPTTARLDFALIQLEGKLTTRENLESEMNLMPQLFV